MKEKSESPQRYEEDGNHGEGKKRIPCGRKEMGGGICRVWQ